MSVESSFNSLLASATATTAIVSTRYYAGAVADPDVTKPYLFWTVLTDDEPGHLVGSSLLSMALIQVTFVATTLAGAVALRDAFRSDMHTYRFVSGNAIDSIRIADSSMTQPLPQSGEAVGVTAVTSDYTVWYTRSAPDPIGA